MDDDLVFLIIYETKFVKWLLVTSIGENLNKFAIPNFEKKKEKNVYLSSTTTFQTITIELSNNKYFPNIRPNMPTLKILIRL